MSLNLLNRHPADVEAEAMLGHPQPYPEGFTFNDRTSARMGRAHLGLVHVMVNLLPAVEDERKEDIHYCLDAILAIVDITRVDAEGRASTFITTLYGLASLIQKKTSLCNCLPAPNALLTAS
ncbi:nicotinic acetylcholine receptor subunit beta [Citrobacter portucalensis]|uniref:nicotinic acetylcholine receptor subunit beta n=1 Tax=Citrobacter portucalensis TaxID=1639133 RepID=UPI003BF46174